ncbi:ribonuclease H [Acidovorax sp. HMWF029]|uniref:ribonuclease HI family protein n=1 Tax=unclassified Acidovorax TaxID=2684926 RepID=UPI000D3A3259|nr:MULTISPECIES: ribonuclease HI family protein [unclassified Acidovorax]MDH4417221.1 ribonuclease HI family protein [Acidovorax sp.]PTT22842.1 ribonuclease H [Acidovorax sp. HMWF029]
MTAARAAAPLAPGTWVIHCDGSAWPNPGRMGLGAVLTGPDGTVQHQISEATTYTGCNNEAELRALMLSLQWLAQQGLAASTPVLVFSDNSVLVEQLGSQPTAPIGRLAALFDEARSALQPFHNVRLQWIPRHRNGAADTLARAALGLAPKVALPPGHREKKKRH